MSLFQTLVLLRFNEGEQFTYDELEQATGVGKIIIDKEIMHTND